MSIANWVESADCALVANDVNGHDRGDGNTVDVFRSRETGRFLIRVIAHRVSWYVADTREDADQVGAGGYPPGHAPGKFRFITAPWRLREIRSTAGAFAATE